MEFLSLLNGQTTEEKIAGVILCERYLCDQNQTLSSSLSSSLSPSLSSSLSPSLSLSSSEHQDSSSFECLCSLLENVSEQFLIQMLQTKSQGDGIGISLHEVAISIFSFLSQHSSLIKRFSPFCSQIFNVALSDNKLNPALFDLILDICSQSDGDFLSLMFKRTLEYVCSNTEDSSMAFSYLIEIALSLNSKLYLESDHSLLLRNVLIQGLQRSSALARDNILIGMMVFLSRIDPQWTFERPSQHSDDKFIQLFVSLLCGGEFRLLLQELTTLTEEPTSSKETISHTVNLLCVCYEIFDMIYELLLGSNDSVGDDTQQSAPIWEALSAASLQTIQKEVTHSIEYYFKFLHHHSNSSENHDIGIVVSRGIMIFIKWIQEDESLHSTFVSYYENILTFTHIPLQNYLVDSRDHRMTQQTQDQILDLVLNIPNQIKEKSDEIGPKKYSGGIGCILISRNRSSSCGFAPSGETSADIQESVVRQGNRSNIGISIINQMILDPFLSSLNCVLVITDNENHFTEIEIGNPQPTNPKPSTKKKKNSGQTIGQQMVYVATCSTPHLQSVLVASYHYLHQYFRTGSTCSPQSLDEENIRQCMLLSSICSELLYLLLTSPTNQMMQSLQILAISTDPTSGEYLKVSYGSWMELRSELNSLIELKLDPRRIFPKKLDEQGDYMNLIEKLGSLEDIFRQVFH